MFWLKLNDSTLMRITRADAEQIRRDFPEATIITK